MEEKLSYFSEWVYWDDEEEREEAIQYLRLWKKFLLGKLGNMEQQGQDQIVIRSDLEKDSYFMNLSRNTIGIKIAMKEKRKND